MNVFSSALIIVKAYIIEVKYIFDEGRIMGNFYLMISDILWQFFDRPISKNGSVWASTQKFDSNLI